jgi:phage terminase large subunit-like protein
MTWTTARPNWVEDILAGRSMSPSFDSLPDKERATEALKIFKSLRISDVPGRPTFEQAAEPWVFDFVAAVFGAYDPAARRQIAREIFLLIAKKNSKSTLAAGIMVTALIMHTRREEEFLILAPTKEIADNSFRPAAGMIEAQPELLRLYKVNHYHREITHRIDGSILAVKAADSKTVGGQKATCVLVDELWEFGKVAAADNILSEAVGSLVSRPEGFAIYLSTQSDQRPAGVFARKLEYHRKVRNGDREDPASLPVIYEFPPKMVEDGSWKDPKNWWIPNPNMHRTVDHAWLVSKASQTEYEGPEAYRVWAAKHLNIQVDIALQSDGWAGAKYWARGEDRTITLKTLIERCEVCCMGSDGGGLDDLLGVGVIGREKGTRRWLAWCHAFISPEGIERRKQNESAYRDFMADGDLTLVEKLPDDLELLVDIAEQLKEANLLATVGVDRIGMPGIVDALAKIDVTVDNGKLVGVAQGISLMGAYKAIERKLVDGTFKHHGGRMMAWCAGNAKIMPTPTAARIARDEAGYGKIDPLMALFDAADGMARNPEPPAPPPSYQMFFVGGAKSDGTDLARHRYGAFL